MGDIENTVFVTIGIFIASFFSYLLQFYLGRTLSVSDYGVFNSLLAIAAIVGVPATVFGTALIKEVASLSAKKEVAKVSSLFWQSIVWSTVIGVIIFGFFYVFKSNVLGSLKLSGTNIIESFALYLSLTFLWSVPYAYLQGLLRYKVFAVFIVASSFLRFVLPVAFLLSSKNVSSIYFAMSLGTIAVIISAIFFLRKDLVAVRDLAVWKEFLYILKFSWPVMVTNICLMAFINNDLIAVRSIFSAETTGYYAGVVTLGKILLYGSTAVATVMFPKISSLKSAGGDTKKFFVKFLRMQLAIVGAGMLVFAVFPKLIAAAFFGTKFLASVEFLPLYSIFIALYVILNFLILFLFGVDIVDLYYLLVILAMSQGLLIYKFHGSLYQVILVNIGILLIAVCGALIKSFSFLKKT